MRKETDTIPAERYLICKNTFTSPGLYMLKRQVIKFMERRNVDTKHYKFINWKETKQEIAVFTTYAYADIELPKKIDTIFENNNPANFVKTDFAITQAVMDGFMAIDCISHGWTHVCVLAFKEEIPPILRLLPSIMYNGKSDSGEFNLGFCLQVDFEAIKERLKEMENYI